MGGPVFRGRGRGLQLSERWAALGVYEVARRGGPGGGAPGPLQLLRGRGHGGAAHRGRGPEVLLHGGPHRGPHGGLPGGPRPRGPLEPAVLPEVGPGGGEEGGHVPLGGPVLPGLGLEPGREGPGPVLVPELCGAGEGGGAPPPGRRGL